MINDVDCYRFFEKGNILFWILLDDIISSNSVRWMKSDVVFAIQLCETKLELLLREIKYSLIVKY